MRRRCGRYLCFCLVCPKGRLLRCLGSKIRCTTAVIVMNTVNDLRLKLSF